MNHRLGSRILVLGSSAVVLALAVHCRDDKPTGPSVENQEPLVFTRENSSSIQFPSTAQTYVWCGPWGSTGCPGIPIPWPPLPAAGTGALSGL
jgi:hypothetical protein